MRCPYCGHKTEVLDTENPSKALTRRYRQCLNPDCKRRFPTEEKPNKSLVGKGIKL